MVKNYDINAGVEFSEWTGGEEPENQYRSKLEECYYDPHTGDLVITFTDRDSDRFFDLSVPVKAVSEWNEFADSLPRWDK